MTIFRMKAKPGERESVVDLFDKWQRERIPEVKGFVHSTIQRPRAGRMVSGVRSHLIADPDWFNGKLERESGNIVP